MTGGRRAAAGPRFSPSRPGAGTHSPARAAQDGARTAAAAASCPWVNSSAPISQRVAAVFGVVRPGQVPSATFTVTPPSYAPSSDQMVHATADLGGSDTREAGVTVTGGG